MKVMKKTVNLLLPNGDKYIGGMENKFYGRIWNTYIIFWRYI